jgi:hypothetical protein
MRVWSDETADEEQDQKAYDSPTTLLVTGDFE